MTGLSPRTVVPFAALVLVFVASGTYALNFSPLVSTIDLDGSRARQRYTLSNPGREPVAVEVSAVTRQIDEYGMEHNSPTDGLAVYPSQIVLDGGERQTVLVEWVGGEIESERAFRIIAEQVPVSFGDDGSSRARLRMSFRYVTSLYVRPPGTAARVSATSARIVTGTPDGAVDADDGDAEIDTPAEARFVEITLENSGSRHKRLRDLTVRVSLPSDNGEERERLEWHGETAPVRAGERSDVLTGVILPDTTRRLRIPLPEEYLHLSESSDLAVTLLE